MEMRTSENYIKFLVTSNLLKSKINRMQTNKRLDCSGTYDNDNIWNTSKKYSIDKYNYST